MTTERADGLEYRRLAVVVFVALGAMASLVASPHREPDSPTYLDLSFVGDSPRLWVVPLLYKLTFADRARQVVQVVIWAAAWSTLAYETVRLLKPKWRDLLFTAVLLLGLTGTVLQYNAAVLSESVAISLTVAIITCWLRFLRCGSWRSAAVLLVVALLWTFTRHMHVVASPALAVGLDLVALVRSDIRRVAAAAAAIAAVIVLVGITTVRASPTDGYSRLAGAEVLLDRVLPSEEYTSWFMDRGLPAQASGKGSYNELLADDETRDWIDKEFPDSYVAFLARFPEVPLTALEDAPVLLGANSGQRIPEVLAAIPAIVQVVFFDDGAFLFSVAVAVAMLAWQSRRGALTRYQRVGLGLLLFALMWYLPAWLLATVDLARLTVTMSVAAHLGLLLMLVPEAALLQEDG